VIHAPEGFVHPALTALMSREAPEDAQGELQGGIASLQSIGLIIGTVLFAQVFGWFMQPNAIVVSPSIAYFLGGGMMVLTLVYFLSLKEARPATRP
jgi:DHA1 family tetracycline resistance protein-like MFS transporter